MRLGLHVLVDPEQLPRAAIGPFCREIRRGGARVVQLRGKHTPLRELLDYGRRLRAATAEQQLLLVVNDRVDLALALNADGVHLGQDDLPVADARRIAPGLIVGSSVGDPQELAQALGDRPDYIGVGPVFMTLSKADAGAPLGIRGLMALAEPARGAGLKVVAIGGIGAANVQAVWRAGVDGVAVISAVMNAASWHDSCRDLLPNS